MADQIEKLVQRSIAPSSVKVDGPLTDPRSYGVFQLPYSVETSSRFHFGNFPVRQHELEREFGSCTLTYLFESRDDAEAVARALNGREV